MQGLRLLLLRLGRFGRYGVALLLAGLVLLLWAPFSAPASRLLLALVPDLEVIGADGPLLGDFQAAQVRYRVSATQTLLLDHLSWRGVQLGWFELHVSRLEVQAIDLQGTSAAPQPTRLPADLVLPLALQVDAVNVQRLEFDAIRGLPVQRLGFALSAGAGVTGHHRIDHLQFDWDRLQARGQLSLGAMGPLPLRASLTLEPLGGGSSATAAADWLAQDWRASLTAQGPLADFSVSAELQARRQSLDASLQIRPAAVMPIARLTARAQGLDLSALTSRLPATALSGEIAAQISADELQSNGLPLGLQVELRNDRPMRIDQQGIPLRRLRIVANSDLNQPQQGTIGVFELESGSAAQPAGQLRGNGSWALLGDGASRLLDLNLATSVEQLQPARLDRRAPALITSGPLAVTLRQPWPTEPASAGSPAAPAGRNAAAWPPAGEFDPQQPLLTLRTDLAGHAVDEAHLPAVRLQLQAAASPRKLLVQTLSAESGPARLRASGRLERGTGNAWRLALNSSLEAFNPALWWPGSNPTWRRGPHRLDGELATDLLLPNGTGAASAALSPLPARLAAVQGRANLTLRPSLLAGLPLAGALSLNASPPRDGTHQAMQADLALQLGTGAQQARLTLAGQLDTSGTQDHWQLQWQAPDLALLTPWLHLLPGDTALRLAGDSRGDITIDGRWPALQTGGQTESTRLQLRTGTADGSALDLDSLNLRWHAGALPDDVLDVQMQLDQLGSGTLQLRSIELRADGQTRAHHADLQGHLQLAALPRGTNGPRSLLVQAHASGGGFQDRESGLIGWHGQLGELTLHDAAAGSNPQNSSPGALLLRTGQAPVRLTHTAESLHLTIGASHADLLNATLALDEFDWRHATPDDRPASDSFSLRARLEPLSVAPLLARAQPGFGWAGDLQLAGRIDVQAGPERMRAELQLHRERGDLLVVEPDNPAAGAQRLGLNELRLALSADRGHWRLSERIAGDSLGLLDGAQTVETSPGALWPGADAAVAGRIDLHIAQLGQWGRWLPAGWRLSGRLDSQAQLSGRFGAPELSGALRGQQIGVRNLLHGVDWSDARLSVALNGETARVEEFHVRAGAGHLSATGGATLGATPSAELTLQADHFTALQRVDRRVVLSGNARLALDANSTRLSGRLRADEGRLDVSQGDAPSLGDDVEIRRNTPAAHGTAVNPGAGSAPRSKPRSTVLDLHADLGNAFTLRGRGINTRLNGELHLTSPANKLTIHGDIRTDDGTYAAYGQKLDIDRGVISFSGPIENPRLDIVAIRPDLDEVRAGVAISGTAQHPRVRLFSEPEMSNTDKLSWLMLGRGSDGLGRTDLALLQRTAYALLAGESDSPSLVERIGLNELSIRQSDGEVRETIVSLGKQLSRRWYVGYERGLNATGGTWQLIYRSAQHFTLRAQSSVTDRALDLIWTWKWGPAAPPAQAASAPQAAPPAAPPAASGSSR